MAKDFVPESYENLHDRANAYSNGVGTVATRFPFHDDMRAPAGQTVQAREYVALSVIADEEIDNPSNIASAVFQA